MHQLPLYSAALAGETVAGLRPVGAGAEAAEASEAADDERLLTGTPSSEIAGLGFCFVPGGGAVGAYRTCDSS